MKKPNSYSGNTLIEVLIATIVVGVILTGVVGAMTTSLKNSSEAQNRQVATRLAQETLEVFTQHKAVSSWTTFTDTPGTTGGNFNCFNGSADEVGDLGGSGGSVSPTTCTAFTVPGTSTQFRRGVKIAAPASNEVNVTVKVIWYDGSNERSTELTQSFFRY